jgi:hypothetical protein
MTVTSYVLPCVPTTLAADLHKKASHFFLSITNNDTKYGDYIGLYTLALKTKRNPTHLTITSTVSEERVPRKFSTSSKNSGRNNKESVT